MDFIKFCLDFSELKLKIKNLKFYFWAIPDYDTGFSITAFDKGLWRVDYEGIPTNYQLLMTPKGFEIIKQGFVTGYGLKYKERGAYKIFRRWRYRKTYY